MTGKIARLPRVIRDQLNRRLDDGQPATRLTQWLNSLPEVQTLLAADFAGRPISQQNLNEWSRHGFRNWKMRQNALEFAVAEDYSDAPASQTASAPSLTDKLVQWLALRLASTAHTLAPADDESDADLRRLRSFAADIVALRRGDLYTRRIAVEEKCLTLLQTASAEKREQEFWEWTKRPDISAKLDLRRQKTKDWHDLLRLMVPEVAPFLPEDPDDRDEPVPDPAALI